MLKFSDLSLVVYILVSWLATRVMSPAELSASSAPLLGVVKSTQSNFPPIVFTKIAFLVLIAFASQVSHLLALALTVIGLLLIGMHKAIAGKQRSAI